MKISYVYNRRNQLHQDGTAPLYLRLSHNSVVRNIKLNISLKPNQWVEAKEQIRYHPEANKLNEFLIQYKSRAQLLAAQFPNESIEELRERIEDKSKENFCSFLESAIESGNIVESTQAQHRVLLNYLKEYSPGLTFAGMTYEFLVKFRTYLKGCYNQKYTRKKVPLSENYINSLFRNLKIYVNEARKRRLIADNPFQGFKIQKSSVVPNFLTLSEVERLSKLEYKGMHPRHKIVRDAFIFSCYTGIRISDLMELRSRDLVEGKIYLKPKKTERHMITTTLNLAILFDGKPLEIWKRYDRKLEHAPIFDVVEFDNTYLKRFGSLMNLPFPLTWHVARHTFAMNLLNNGMPLKSVSSLLGHRSIVTTEIYSRLLPQTIEENLMDLNKKLRSSSLREEEE